MKKKLIKMLFAFALVLSCLPVLSVHAETSDVKRYTVLVLDTSFIQPAQPLSTSKLQPKSLLKTYRMLMVPIILQLFLIRVPPQQWSAIFRITAML